MSFYSEFSGVATDFARLALDAFYSLEIQPAPIESEQKVFLTHFRPF